MTTLTFDFTSQNIWSLCPQKGKYYLMDGLRSKLASPAPYFGICIHEALAKWHDPRLENNEGRKVCSEIINALVSMAVSRDFKPIGDGHIATCAKCSAYHEFMTHAFDPTSPLIELEHDNARSITRGLTVLEHYMLTFSQTEDEYRSQTYGDKEPIIEMISIVELGASERWENILYKGKIDGAWERKRDSRPFIVDHKTTSQLGAMFLAKAKPNHQYTGYLLMAEILGIPAQGLIINAINTSKTAHDGKRRAKGPVPFDRIPTTRTKEDFAKFIEDMKYKADMIGGYIEAGHYPKNAPDSCVSFNTKCEFMTLCTSPDRTHKSLIDSEYVVSDWMGWEVSE